MQTLAKLGVIAVAKRKLVIIHSEFARAPGLNSAYAHMDHASMIRPRKRDRLHCTVLCCIVVTTLLHHLTHLFLMTWQAAGDVLQVVLRKSSSVGQHSQTWNPSRRPLFQGQQCTCIWVWQSDTFQGQV